MLRAFENPLDDVRVLIVGQDPYPTPGHAVGLSFSVAPDVRPIPRSLQNIYTELGTAPPSTIKRYDWAADPEERRLPRRPASRDDPRR